MTPTETVLEAIRFIESNLQEDIGVSDVSGAVHFSQFYFSRQFSRCARISIYDYILRRRISESYKALFRDRTRIIDIAVQYGFQSGEGYARAFRKVFGENPSEACCYKPFDVYEAIDGGYLSFLDGLEADIAERPAQPCFFEVETLSDLRTEGDLLVCLSKEHLKGIATIFSGRVRFREERALAYRLEGLTHKASIRHDDVERAFRYFTDNLYDAAEMHGNYILIRKNADRIDFFVPAGECI